MACNLRLVEVRAIEALLLACESGHPSKANDTDILAGSSSQLPTAAPNGHWYVTAPNTVFKHGITYQH